ncbi:hypothetical protein EDB86DRAFT_2831373 [Lactarius hatsudake]|nr:hypothetical protein EDB86DRAFT_2831373 [Lactarius hatsudake]
MARNGGDRKLTTHLPPLSGMSLRIDTRLGADDGRTIQYAMSVGEQEASTASPMLCDSPVQLFACDGWCSYDGHHPTSKSIIVILVFRLAARLGRSQWIAGDQCYITILACSILSDALLASFFHRRKHPPIGMQPRPSYRDLMSHVNFELHKNALELHKYTRYQKKNASQGRGDGFDGELDNFQEPQLSSFAKLNMDDILDL